MNGGVIIDESIELRRFHSECSHRCYEHDEQGEQRRARDYHRTLDNKLRARPDNLLHSASGWFSHPTSQPTSISTPFAAAQIAMVTTARADLAAE